MTPHAAVNRLGGANLTGVSGMCGLYSLLGINTWRIKS